MRVKLDAKIKTKFKIKIDKKKEKIKLTKQQIIIVYKAAIIILALLNYDFLYYSFLNLYLYKS